jgi:hypothetical protein
VGVLSYNEVSGLGYVEAIAALVGGLAQGGASAYGTYEMAKAAKGQQKLNKKALQIEAELRRRELEALQEKNRRDSLASQARAVIWSQTAQVAVAGGALVAVGVYVLPKLFGTTKRKGR